MTKRPLPQAVAVSRARSISTRLRKAHFLAGACGFALLLQSHVQSAQAACPGEVIINAPGTILAPAQCITVNSVVLNGSLTNATVIGDSGVDDAFVVSNSTITGGLFNTGSITASGGVGVHTIGSVIQGGFSNSGLIDGLDGFELSGSNLFGGWMNSGTITGAGDAVSVDATTFTGGLANSGNISGQYGILLDGTTFNGGLSNTGSIAASIRGIRIQTTTFNGGLLNSGSIASDSRAVVISSTTFNGGLANSGTIFGDATAVEISSTITTGSVLNSGLITARGGANPFDIGVSITSTVMTGNFHNQFGGEGVGAGEISGNTAVRIDVTNFNGNVFNDGLIEGSDVAILLSDTLLSGSIANTGVIVSGVSTVGVGINLVNSEVLGAINNSGMIDVGPGGTGIAISSGHVSGGIFNSGTIVATTAIQLGLADAGHTVTQSGAGAVISGNIGAINAHADVLNFNGGRVEGVVFGNSTDVVNVNAGSGFVGLIGGIQDFGALNINSGTAVMGSTAPGIDGVGVVINGINDVNVATGAQLYLDDDTAISTVNATFAPGSSLGVYLTPNTAAHGFLNASNVASLDGELVAYIDAAAFVASGQSTFAYANIIPGAVLGTFDSVSLVGGNGLFDIEVIYSSVSLVISFTSFAALYNPNSPNQVSVGNALDAIFLSGPSDPDLLNVMTVISMNPAPAAQAILNSIAGATSAETQYSALRADDPWKQSVAQRIDAARSAGCTVSGTSWCHQQYANASQRQPEIISDAEAFGWLEEGLRDAESVSLWGRMVGVWGETDGDISSPASKQDLVGFIGGVDHVVTPQLLVGMAGLWSRTEAGYEASADTGEIESFQIGPYFSYGTGTFVSGNASLIFSETETGRHFSVGLIGYDAAAEFSSLAITAAVEAGTIFEEDGLRIEPSLGWNISHQATETYSETGAGGLGLIIASDDTLSLRSSLGLKISRVFELEDRNFVPEVRFDWRHEWLDRRQAFTAAFAAAPNATFHVQGSTSTRDVFAIGTSVTLPLTGRMTGYLDAEGAFAEDSRFATVSAGVRATW